MSPTRFPITSDRYDAVLLDLDGVLTATAGIHAACWQRTFNEFLRRHMKRIGGAFWPFDVDHDYKLYVDGKPRYDGIVSFLKSRGIDLPYGDPTDSSDRETVCGLGNRKNSMVTEILEAKGVEVFEGSVAFVHRLRDEGIKTAVVSSSNNCEAVLRAAGIAGLFDVRVDGEVATRLGLTGKPAPDTFLEAARRLRVEPDRAVVVEDALAGIRAGRNGGFGLVVGINREGDDEVLRSSGAHLVVSDLAELLVE